MSRYLKSAATAKRGINHVRTVVEAAGSLLIKIEQENDVGIDDLIELIQSGRPPNLRAIERKRWVPRTAGDRRSEVKEERRAQPGAGDTSAAGHLLASARANLQSARSSTHR
jgi:hypothetical protein